MWRELAYSRVLRTALAIFAIYWLTVLVFPYEFIGQSLVWIRLVLVVPVFFAYSSYGFEALRAKEITASHQLVLGILLGMFALGGLSAWSVAGSWFGFTTAAATSMVSGFFVLCGSLACVLHLTAPEGIKRQANMVRSWTVVLASTAIGCALSGLIFGLRLLFLMDAGN